MQCLKMQIYLLEQHDFWMPELWFIGILDGLYWVSLEVDRVDRDFLITIVSVSAWKIIFGLTGFSFWALLGAHICSFIFDFWAPLPFYYGLSQFLALLSQICNSFNLSFAQTTTFFVLKLSQREESTAPFFSFGYWGSSEVSKSRWRDVWAYAQLAAETNWGPEMLGQWKVFLASAVTIQLTSELSSWFTQI